MYVQNKATLLAIINALIAEDGLYDGAKIGVFQNDVYPTVNSVIGDLTISTFNGITAYTAITWGTAFLNAQSQAEVLGQLVNFLTTSAPTLPITAYGYAIVNADNSALFLAERFATPFIFNASGQYLGIVPRVMFSN